MCQPASLIITRDKVFWSRKTDFHDEIMREFGLNDEVAGKITLVKVEITPPNGDMRIPIEQWQYRVDQDLLPDWYEKNPDKHEANARAALWLEFRNRGRRIAALAAQVADLGGEAARLRRELEALERCAHQKHESLHAALLQIEQQEQVIASLRHDNDTLRKMTQRLGRYNASVGQACADLRLENAGMREALRGTMAVTDGGRDAA